MFSHVTLGTNDIERAKRFYDAVLGEIGLVCRLDARDTGWIGYTRPDEERPELLICRPRDGRAASVGNGTTIAFDVQSRALVDRFHAAAVAAGGGSAGAPATRPAYHPNFYGAYVRDPDGHKLCCACQVAPPALQGPFLETDALPAS